MAELKNTEREKAVKVQLSSITGGIQPVQRLHTIEKTNAVSISEEDYNVLLKIVEAEAGGEDIIGKILVANVVLNRLNDDAFPDSVEKVVFQQENGVAQFSPISNGTYERSVADEETIEAVQRALGGEDYSQGALYFAARKYANPSHMQWFDESLIKVLTYGGHEFYK